MMRDKDGNGIDDTEIKLRKSMEISNEMKEMIRKNDEKWRERKKKEEKEEV